MKLEAAKAILGPIRCGTRRQRYLGDDLIYYIDGVPGVAQDVIVRAQKAPDFIKARMLKADAEAAQERQRKRQEIGTTSS